MTATDLYPHCSIENPCPQCRAIPGAAQDALEFAQATISDLCDEGMGYLSNGRGMAALGSFRAIQDVCKGIKTK